MSDETERTLMYSGIPGDHWAFNEMRTRVEYDFISDTVTIGFAGFNRDRSVCIIEDVIMRTYQENEPRGQSRGVRLPTYAARQLMNQLWLAGFRPADDVASTGQVEAMKAHIETLKATNNELTKTVNHLLAVVEKGRAE